MWDFRGRFRGIDLEESGYVGLIYFLDICVDMLVRYISLRV